MNTQNKLIDMAVKVCNPPNATGLAKKLGVTKAAVSMWRHGGKIKDDHLMALIKVAQADPALAVLVRTEGAETADAKKAWGVVWDRLSPVTTVIGGLVLAIGMMPATGRTKPLDIQELAQADCAYSVYYVKTVSTPLVLP
ncbi:hypothetical protein NY98_21510 [Xanthomonas citri pv. fuscans]|uniref:Phage-related protein n=1 Tax=Xanthomonas citri pv. fuscans TaxID=366649 RepID=A0AB34Q3D1_XANCI|nr:DUF3693 domain-containing protein [Xanthomonas citri]ATS78014.1 hypothetical protein XcfCFBP6975P_21775 [Xanthomonas citri pv. phaseoli var. fuscans]ATS80409.1 hypothetical protein XcfCFBP7767P_11980 [Xanthomonas citri pv. phaseoli var. fuscans]ATS90125.1 hypothetical protein XcfCFBP6167P_19110 [Xanthomonas citri pv. phaseoli var. fuscans]AZU17648.1 hypothetical protein AC613_11310 [Xanthomonas citri pv. fuscans]AZU21697.1 hypothetical protein AC612_11310 [Xanthomonas citri pv. fuscans]